MGRNLMLVAVFLAFVKFITASYVSVSPDGYQDVVISIDENADPAQLTCDQIAEKLQRINVRTNFFFVFYDVIVTIDLIT